MKKLLMIILSSIPLLSFAKSDKKLKEVFKDKYSDQVKVEEIDICESRMGTQDIWIK